MPKHKSSDYKESAVNYYLVSDETQESVCEIFKCSPRSLMRWVDKYLEDGEIKRKNRKPIAYKVKKEHGNRHHNLYVLIDNCDGESEKVARRLIAAGVKRVAILTGGELSVQQKGQSIQMKQEMKTTRGSNF